MDDPKKIDLDRLPKHVAIIMDGNGRWAKQRGMARPFGHKNAMKAVRAAIEISGELGIQNLTLYAFSTENWNRPSDEVNILFALLVDSLQKECRKMANEGIRLETIGEMNRFPEVLLDEIQKVKDATKKNDKTILTLALNYGAKAEIINAVKEIAKGALEGTIDVNNIDEQLFENHLYTKDIPPVDLMIRTSGEFRVSNFLLWQMAYAEFYFSNILWPDFRKAHFEDAIIEFQKRERRFGLVDS